MWYALLIGRICDAIGSVFVAFAALKVHHRVLNEHTIDDRVFQEMKREQVIGVIGVVLIVFGFFLELSVLFM